MNLSGFNFGVNFFREGLFRDVRPDGWCLGGLFGDVDHDRVDEGGTVVAVSVRHYVDCRGYPPSECQNTGGVTGGASLGLTMTTSLLLVTVRHRPHHLPLIIVLVGHCISRHSNVVSTQSGHRQNGCLMNAVLSLLCSLSSDPRHRRWGYLPW
jgi:hypothetical protein